MSSLSTRKSYLCSLMKSLLYISFCLILLSCTNTKERDEMIKVMERAAQQNKTHDSITHVNAIHLAVKFFDQHGSANEKVRAHYLLGCAYRDMGEAPRAVQYFQEAAEHADTTSSDCDYRLLSANYGQMADLFYEQRLPYDMLEALSIQYWYLLKCNDTLQAIQCKQMRVAAWELVGNSDNIMSVGKRSYQEFCKHGYYQEAAQSLGTLIPTLINKRLYNEARQTIQIYETKSGFFKNGEIIKGKEDYYYQKGLYSLATHQLDDAEYHFRKTLKLGHDLNSQILATRGLALLYKKLEIGDSIGKYAFMYAMLNDSNYKISTTQELRHMHSLYNYGRNQKFAQAQEKRANRNFTLFIVSASLTILIIILCVSVFMFYHQRKKNELNMLHTQYEHDIEALEQAKYDAIRLTEKQHDDIVAEKTAYIQELQSRIEQYQAILNISSGKQLEEYLAQTNIYKRLKYLTYHPQTKVTTEEWEELQQIISHHLPQFTNKVYSPQHDLKPEEYGICLLVRLYFCPSDIAILTNQSVQYISIKRARLLQKIFHRKGSAADFDKMIRNLN